MEHVAAAPEGHGHRFAIVRRGIDDTGVIVLLREFREEQILRYGHADPLDADPSNHSPPKGLLLVAYDGSMAVGCAGYRWHDRRTGLVEIRKLYVSPSARRHGLGPALLSEIEGRALTVGATCFILETGVRNRGALRVFAAAGYHRVPPYVAGRDPSINRAFIKGGAVDLPDDRVQITTDQ
jgi:GNAT superfamily N-acetyltransferase